MVIEIIFKILVTVIYLVISYIFLAWFWTQQIDIKQTILRPFIKYAQGKNEIFVTRDPSIIYQNGKSVGNISGNVEEINGKLIFSEIYNTSGLDYNLPFDYKRERLKIIKIGSIIGMQTIAALQGSSVKNNVLKNVVCERIK